MASLGTACSVEGCNRGTHSKGMCKTHYLRVYRTGSPDLPREAPTRVCSFCDLEKPRESFAQMGAKGRMGTKCHTCSRAQEFIRRGELGYTTKELSLWISEREARNCEICHEAEGTHIDHDHATGLLRGLLCLKCNAVLGMAQDSQTILLNAVSYLDKAAK